MRNHQFKLNFVMLLCFASAVLADISCSHPEMNNYLQTLATKFSNISKLSTIGRSVQGRDLLVMVIADFKLQKSKPILRPQVKFVGNIMGNSFPSCFVLLSFIEHLLFNYERIDSLERILIESAEIHVIPNMNPDNFSLAIPGKCDGKVENGSNQSLDRDFLPLFDAGDELDLKHQPELLSLMAWITKNNFVSSITYVTGTRAVKFPPFESTSQQGDMKTTNDMHEQTPDNDVFLHLKSTYVANVKDVRHGQTKQVRCQFEKVNETNWSPASKKMVDYGYEKGTLELLIGISCCRNLNSNTKLQNIWLNHKSAMLLTIQELTHAFRGRIVDTTGKGIHLAKLQTFNLNLRDNPSRRYEKLWFSNVYGDFWKLLRPGEYLLMVTKEGFNKTYHRIEVRAHEKLQIRIELGNIQELETTVVTLVENEQVEENKKLGCALKILHNITGECGYGVKDYNGQNPNQRSGACLIFLSIVFIFFI